jgi:hypothetical protein
LGDWHDLLCDSGLFCLVSMYVWVSQFFLSLIPHFIPRGQRMNFVSCQCFELHWRGWLYGLPVVSLRAVPRAHEKNWAVSCRWLWVHRFSVLLKSSLSLSIFCLSSSCSIHCWKWGIEVSNFCSLFLLLNWGCSSVVESCLACVRP